MNYDLVLFSEFYTKCSQIPEWMTCLNPSGLIPEKSSYWINIWLTHKMKDFYFDEDIDK